MCTTSTPRCAQALPGTCMHRGLLWPCRGRGPWPCRRACGRVVGAVPHAWLPCRGLAGRVTTQPKPCLLLPWSQYTSVYCDTIPYLASFSLSQYTKCIVTQYLKPTCTPIAIQFVVLQYSSQPTTHLSCNTIPLLQYNH